MKFAFKNFCWNILGACGAGSNLELVLPGCSSSFSMEAGPRVATLAEGSSQEPVPSIHKATNHTKISPTKFLRIWVKPLIKWM